MLNLYVLKKIIIFLILISCYSFVVSTTQAKSIDEDIADLAKQIADLDSSISPLKKESSGLQGKIAAAKVTVAKMEGQILTLGQKLIDKETDLEVQKVLLSERVRKYYINSRKYNPMLILFASSESTSLLRSYSWYQAVINQDKNTITTYVTDISKLNDNKKNLESEKTKLAAIKKSFESRFGFLTGEIKKAEAY